MTSFAVSNRFTALVCLLILLLTGCGKLPATVSGQVTLDGKPLSTGNIAFNPVKSGSVAIGSIDSQGSYRVSSGTESGLQPGDYVVTVVATEAIAPPMGNEAPKPPALLTPAKYQSPATSDLKVTITAGSNSYSPALKSN
jgi:hypothetical protein